MDDRVYHIPTRCHGRIKGVSGAYIPIFHVELDNGAYAIATAGDLLETIVPAPDPYDQTRNPSWPS